MGLIFLLAGENRGGVYLSNINNGKPIIFFWAQDAFPPQYCPLPSASIARPWASLHCRPQPATKFPSRPLKSRAAGPFLLPLPLYVRPLPFDALNVARVPVGPSGLSHPQVHPFASVAPVRSPLMSPLTCWLAPLSVPRSFASQASGSPVLVSVCYRLYRPFDDPSIGFFWFRLMLGFLFLGVFMCDG